MNCHAHLSGKEMNSYLNVKEFLSEPYGFITLESRIQTQNNKKYDLVYIYFFIHTQCNNPSVTVK